MNMKSIRSLGAFVTLAILAGASAPQAWAATIQMSTMTYQGRLRESGLPVTGARSVEIKLCDDPTGGSCVASPWQNVSVSTGLFRTTFSVSGVDLSAKPWYLEVRVGAAGGAPTNTLAPREALTASPYAIHSSSAAFAFLSSSATTLVAGSIPEGAVISTHLFVVNGSRVGIGTLNPSYTLALGSETAGSFGVENSDANSGKTLTIRGSNGGASGAAFGGQLTLQAGDGGTSGTAANGGTMNIFGGAAGAGNYTGGSINLGPGLNSGTGIVGAVEIQGGGGGAHLRSTQATPPGIAFAGCGTVNTPNITGTDMAGLITFNINPAGGPGCSITLTFNKPYGGAPKAVLISPASALSGGAVGAAAWPGAYVDYTTVTGAIFQIKVNNALPIGNHGWYYMVIE